MEKLMTAAEVGQMLRLEPHAVYRFAREGAIPSIRVGERKLRFSEAALRDWMARQLAEAQRKADAWACAQAQ